MAPSRAITAIELLVVIAVLVILMVLLTPRVSTGPSHISKAKAKSDVVQIATAVTAFEAEYGRLPGSSSGPVDGHVLAMLMGSNKPSNPRQIVFLEVGKAKRNISGVTNGVYVDPWGGAYQIAFAEGTNTHVVAGTNGIEVPKRVAVWNDPRLEKIDQNWFSAKKLKSRYVTSWD